MLPPLGATPPPHSNIGDISGNYACISKTISVINHFRDINISSFIKKIPKITENGIYCQMRSKLQAVFTTIIGDTHWQITSTTVDQAKLIFCQGRRS